MTIEVGMPVYRPSGRLEAVLTAFGMQTDKDFFITIYNDTNPEETEEIIKDEEIINLMRVKYNLNISLIQNPYNYGYMKNMRQIFENAIGDVIFLFADDDIISLDCIELIRGAFSRDDVGIVGRPYYWFIDDMRKAVRFKGEINRETKYVDLIEGSYEDVSNCISCADQLSGLAFRTKCFNNMPFEEDMFTAHVYPYLHVFANYKCAYLPHPTVAVSISTSQCHTDIYDSSPLGQWAKIYNIILSEEKYDKVRREQIYRSATDYLGLAQIKNYGTYKELFTEIGMYIKLYPQNLLKLKFYLFAIGSILCPKIILRRATEVYKSIALSKQLEKMNINYDIFPIDVVEKLWNKPQADERVR